MRTKDREEGGGSRRQGNNRRDGTSVVGHSNHTIAMGIRAQGEEKRRREDKGRFLLVF